MLPLQSQLQTVVCCIAIPISTPESLLHGIGLWGSHQNTCWNPVALGCCSHQATIGIVVDGYRGGAVLCVVELMPSPSELAE